MICPNTFDSAVLVSRLESMTNAKLSAPRKRAHAPTKDAKDQYGNFLPSTEPEMAAAGLVGVRLYLLSEGKQLGIALQKHPVACHYGYGTWHLYYKAKRR